MVAQHKPFAGSPCPCHGRWGGFRELPHGGAVPALNAPHDAIAHLDRLKDAEVYGQKPQVRQESASSIAGASTVPSWGMPSARLDIKQYLVDLCSMEYDPDRDACLQRCQAIIQETLAQGLRFPTVQQFLGVLTRPTSYKSKASQNHTVHGTQSGFRAGRGTRHPLFTLRRAMEWSDMTNHTLQFLFLVWKQAFD